MKKRGHTLTEQEAPKGPEVETLKRGNELLLEFTWQRKNISEGTWGNKKSSESPPEVVKEAGGSFIFRSVSHQGRG